MAALTNVARRSVSGWSESICRRISCFGAATHSNRSRICTRAPLWSDQIKSGGVRFWETAMSHATAVLQRHDDAEIPILDLAPYLAGPPAALEELAVQLRYALQKVGFYFIKGHGVPQSLCDEVFEQAERFHAQPLDWKLKLTRNRDNVGYLPMTRAAGRDGKIKPNVNEAFFVKRDLPPDHPDVLARKRFRGTNRWPQDLPGFRESVVAYCDALEALAKKLVPIYAVALDL